MPESENVLISVIIVTYNAEKCIKATLDSLYQQTAKGYEVLLIDGKSVDSTVQILHEYIEKFKNAGILVRLISEHDRGIYDAMNKGIDLAAGKYGFFLNAGDLLYNESVFENVCKEFHDSIDIIYGNIIDDYGYKQELLQAGEIKSILYKMPFCHQAVFTKIKLLKRYLYNIHYSYCADYDMYLRMYLDNKIFRHCSEIIAIYSRDGASSNNTIAVLKQYKAIQKIQNIYSIRQMLWFYYRIALHLLRSFKQKVWRCK